MLERKSTYSIEEIKDFLGDYPFNTSNPKPKDYPLLDGDPIKPSSDRYKTFFNKGCTCVTCELKGSFFAKERVDGSNERYHLNLYGINEHGHEVLMTKDHIIPKSKGGKNSLINYQTMCTKCNEQKGNQVN